MNLIKSAVCLSLFLVALFGASWPILHKGEVDWLFDMDIKSGVQIIYRADFTSLPIEKRTVEQKRRLRGAQYPELL